MRYYWVFLISLVPVLAEKIVDVTDTLFVFDEKTGEQLDRISLITFAYIVDVMISFE